MNESFIVLFIGTIFVIDVILDSLHRKTKEEFNEKIDDIKREINTLKEDIAVRLDSQSEKACSMQNKSVQDNDSLESRTAELCRLCGKEIIMNNVNIDDVIVDKMVTDNRYSDIPAGDFQQIEERIEFEVFKWKCLNDDEKIKYGKELFGFTAEELEQIVGKSQNNEYKRKSYQELVKEGVRAILEDKYSSVEEYIKSIPEEQYVYDSKLNKYLYRYPSRVYKSDKDVAKSIRIHLTYFMGGIFTYLRRKLGFTQEECEEYYKQYVNRK